MKSIIPQSSYIMKCLYCDTEFTYQSEDLYVQEENGEHCRVVNCPVCNRQNRHRERLGKNLIDTMHC